MAYLCMGSSVSECLEALDKSHRCSGTHKGENLVACSLRQPDVLRSTHLGPSRRVTWAGLLGELLSLAWWVTLTSSWVDLHLLEPCSPLLHHYGRAVTIAFPWAMVGWSQGSKVAGRNIKPSFCLLIPCEPMVSVKSHLLGNGSLSVPEDLNEVPQELMVTFGRHCVWGSDVGSNLDAAPPVKTTGDSLRFFESWFLPLYGG